jgi:predicted Zn-dependent protease with MMP-like domain
MERAAFEQLVRAALESLPKEFKKKLENIDVVVEDYPSPELMAKLGLRSPVQILGLYQGVPLKRRGPYYGNVLPDRIIIFQGPIERYYWTDAEVTEAVRRVVLHEVGHYFGLDDKRLRELQY